MNPRILAEIIIALMATWAFFKTFFFFFMPKAVKETLKTRKAAKKYDKQLKERDNEKDGKTEKT